MFGIRCQSMILPSSIHHPLTSQIKRRAFLQLSQTIRYEQVPIKLHTRFACQVIGVLICHKVFVSAVVLLLFGCAVFKL